jgi:hypothetical protein
MPGDGGGWNRLGACLIAVPLLVGCISRAAPTPVTALPSSSGPTAAIPTASVAPTDPSLPARTPGPLASGDAAAVFERVSPSVVFVGTPIGTGSGIILDARHILTNAHVVRPFREARLVDVDGRELGTATVVGWDLLADVAVLEAPRQLAGPPIAMGQPEQIRTGAGVFLVGFPGADPAAPRARISEGIVTGRPREWHDDLTFYDSDAEIDDGQSGGALVDAEGALLGLSGGSWGAMSVSLDARDAFALAARLLAGEDVDGLGDRLPPDPAPDGDREVRADVLHKADAHAWVVAGRQGDPDVTIRMTATGGDVGLYGLAAGGQLAHGAGRPGRDLSLTMDFDPPGPYLVKIEAPTVRPARVHLLSTAPLTPLVDPDDGPVLRVGDVHIGAADYGGDLDWFTLRLAKDDRVVIRVAAAGFDPALFVDAVDTGETIGAGSDDGGPLGMDDVLRLQAPRDGDYRIVVSDIRFFGFGGYRLEVERA